METWQGSNIITKYSPLSCPSKRWNPSEEDINGPVPSFLYSVHIINIQDFMNSNRFPKGICILWCMFHAMQFCFLIKCTHLISIWQIDFARRLVLKMCFLHNGKIYWIHFLWLFLIFMEYWLFSAINVYALRFWLDHTLLLHAAFIYLIKKINNKSNISYVMNFSMRNQ